MSEINEYIAQFPKETQERLKAIRETVRELVPQATERICMRMPTVDLNGKWLVHYAGFDKHIGFYPQPSAILAFAERLASYKTSKGTVQFPLNQPLPIDLIREMVKWRIAEQTEDGDEPKSL